MTAGSHFYENNEGNVSVMEHGTFTLTQEGNSLPKKCLNRYLNLKRMPVAFVNFKQMNLNL